MNENKKEKGEFPGSSCLGLYFHCREFKFDSWSGNYDPASDAARPEREKERKVNWKFFSNYNYESKLTNYQLRHLEVRIRGFPGGSDGKESAWNAGNPGSIPGSERSPGAGRGNPLQYSCLENPRDRAACWAAICGVAQSRTRLRRLCSSSSNVLGNYQSPYWPGGKEIPNSSLL